MAKFSRTLAILAGAAAFGILLLGAASPVRRVRVSEGTDVSLTISPDHNTIIMDLQESLWSLPAGGGTAKRLTDPFLEPTQPNWSPKGDLVAFQSFKGGTFHIWVMKPDGSGVRQLTFGHGDDREPRFSPDGREIAFSSDRAFKGNYDIWVVDVASGKLAQWTADPAEEYEPAWSVDGQEIAFISGTGGGRRGGRSGEAATGAERPAIQAIDASGVRKTILTGPAGARLDSPSFSPDGKKMAYIQVLGRQTRLMVSGEPVGSADDVFPFPAAWLSSNELLYAGNGKILVSTLDGATRSIPFQATFTLNRPPYKHRHMDFDTTAPRPVKGIMEPALSPDGRRIVFEALNQLWLMEIGGKPRQLTHDGFYKSSPSWSPDGTKIAYWSDKSGAAEIYILDWATGEERRLPTPQGAGARSPAWSPDGHKIAFQNQSGATSVIDLSTGEIQDAIPGSFRPSKPSWFKNGSVLSVSMLRPYSHRFREGTNLIQTMDLATRKITLTEPAPYRSIMTRGADGPVYSPDGTQIAFVMGGYLWTRPVDDNGIPTGEARQINQERADAPTWRGDSKQILYLSNGKLRLIAADGSGGPREVPLDFTYRRASSDRIIVIHAGRLWDGLGPNERTNVDITIVGRRIRSIEAHRDVPHPGAELVDASNLTVMPGLWDAHVHEYGGLYSSGDREGRFWLAYGFTGLQSQGDGGYEQLETRESFATGSRVGPRYFATGEIIDGERQYYPLHHGVMNEQELRFELARAKALDYDNVKTYVRLPHEFQKEATQFAHLQLGVWVSSHYGMPGITYGMDQIAHLSDATSRWGYSYTLSHSGVSYQDIRALFIGAGETMESTPVVSNVLYAEDPAILDDDRVKTLAMPAALRSAMANRDRALNGDRKEALEGVKAEEDTLIALLHGGVSILLGSDGGFPVFNHLALRGEVKFGMKAWEALQTATLLPAKALGYGKDLGSIEPGKLADIVMVAGDPLRDIKDAARVQKVIVDGRVYSMSDLTAPFAFPAQHRR